MQIGRLNKRIAIQSMSLQSDGAGGGTSVWTTEAVVWGAIEPLSAREVYEGERVNGILTHRITMRYREGVTPSKRLVYDGRVFNIEPPTLKRERKHMLTIMAREVVEE